LAISLKLFPFTTFRGCVSRIGILVLVDVLMLFCTMIQKSRTIVCRTAQRRTKIKSDVENVHILELKSKKVHNFIRMSKTCIIFAVVDHGG
jgi:hypothetical protein